MPKSPITMAWTIKIHESPEIISATITNMKTKKTLNMSVRLRDYNGNRDNALGDLFSGPLPNVRDSFDTV